MASLTKRSEGVMIDRWQATLILFVCLVFVQPAIAGAGCRGAVSREARRARVRSVKIAPGFEARFSHRRGSLASGVWGGQHIHMEVTAAGATVEYDCAQGTIPKRIAVDRQGRFVVKGTHVVERGGPVRQADASKGDPVQFTGRVSGKKLQLTVRRDDSKEVIGVFTLFHGQAGKLVKCR